MSRSFADCLAALIYPDRCLLCGKVIRRDTRFCHECMILAPRMDPPLCSYCGRSRMYCDCGKRHRRFDRAAAAFLYTEEIKSAVLSLKQYGYRHAVYAFAWEMTETVRREYGVEGIDAVTFVPMSREDEGNRGFNQAYLLAKEVARQLGLPCRRLLAKICETRPQKTLKAVERIGNVIGVFDALEDVRGMRILLVDDLITTGSTLDECAKMLKLAGAEQVLAITAAGALPPAKTDKNKEDT